MHTGYLPTASVKYPAFGVDRAPSSIPNPSCELPAFVRIGGGGADGGGGGLLGVEYDPFVMPNAGTAPTNTALATDADRYRRRLDLLDRLESRLRRERRQAGSRRSPEAV